MLGTLLLNNSLLVNARPLPEGAEGGVAPPAVSPGSPPGVDDFVILSPSLGFPAFADSSRMFNVLLLSKNNGLGANDYVEALKWQQYDKAYLGSGSAVNFPGVSEGPIIEEDSIAEYKQKIASVGTAKFDRIYGRLNPNLVDLYEGLGYTTLVTLRLQLTSLDNNISGLFTLRTSGEDGRLQEILRNLEAPYEGCPNEDLLDRTVEYSDWVDERFGVLHLHPVRVFATSENLSFLNIAHITDMHISRRWDFMQKWTSDSYSTSTPASDRHKFAEQLHGKTIVNANSNYEAVLQQIYGYNQPAGENVLHAAVQTGDLIEYCRGYDGKLPGKYDDSTFQYSTNWILYYQILASNYNLPTFTLLGNHDWRMNPYAPSPKLGFFANFGLLMILLLTFWVASMGPVAIIRLFKYLWEDDSDDTSSADYWISLFGFVFLAGIVGMVSMLFAVFSTAAIIGLSPSKTGPSMHKNVVKYSLLGGVVLGAAVVPFALLFSGAAMLLGGPIAGSILWALIFIVIRGLFPGVFGIRYLDAMVGLEEQGVTTFFHDNNDELDLFGDNSLFEVTDKSFIWYSLVINPFMDYGFDYERNYFAFLDWNEAEALEFPPIAGDALSDSQLGLLSEWATRAMNGQARDGKVRPVLLSHFPIFSQSMNVDMIKMKRTGIDMHSNNLERGILDDNRDELVRRLEGLGSDAPPLVLSGHTHAYGVFQKKENSILFFGSQPDGDHEKQVELGTINQGKPTYVVTICSGPPGDHGDDQKNTQLRQPGYRRIYFDAEGTIVKMTESDVPGAKQVE